MLARSWTPRRSGSSRRHRRASCSLGGVAVFALGGGGGGGRRRHHHHDHHGPADHHDHAPRCRWRRSPGCPATTATGSTAPALVVKIDNGEPKARPQVGINQADVVYEERVEGSVTRLAGRLPLHRLRARRPGAVGPHVRHRHLHAARTTRTSRGAGPTPPSPGASVTPPCVDVGLRRPQRRVLPRAEPAGARAT